MQDIIIDLKERSYALRVGYDLAADTPTCEALRAVVKGRRCLIVSDSQVAPLYAAAVEQLLTACDVANCALQVFPAGESSKTLATLETLYSAGIRAGLDRQAVVVALGGGVVGDVAGFFAATFLRGLPVIQMPTTLLAQVDSSIGGKTGVDLPAGKNLVGAFHQPAAVLADLNWLKTLPSREWRCGMAEVVKYAMIGDAGLFAFLGTNAAAIQALAPTVVEEMVRRCAGQKATVVGRDEREVTGLRATLNYGHTFGHALEVLGGYSLYNHGEAVAIGMSLAADLAVALHLASPDLPQQQDALLRAFGLPTRFAGSAALTPEAILAAMQHDKKVAGGKLRFIVTPEIGRAETVTVADRELLLAVIGGRRD